MVRSPIRRMTVAAIVVAATTTLQARADAPLTDKKICIAAAERGQELRDAKQMRDARGQFTLCARPECPAKVAAECTRWLAEAEAALASVRLAAADGQGHALTNVRVVVDGQPWTDEISPEPVFLDPGSHEIRFERPGADPVVHTITLAMGERDRAVKATFLDPSAKEHGQTAAERNDSKQVVAQEGGLGLPIAFAAVGVAAIGGAVTFWLIGNSDLSAARARCAAGCPGETASSAKTKHIIGDVALGVGLVSLGLATYFYVTRKPGAAAAAASAGGVRF